MKDSKLKSLFEKHSEELVTPKSEWKEIKEKTRLVPLPQRLGVRMGIAFTGVCLFTYTLSPSFTGNSVNENELVEYMLEDSIPHEDEFQPLLETSLSSL